MSLPPNRLRPRKTFAAFAGSLLATMVLIGCGDVIREGDDAAIASADDATSTEENSGPRRAVQIGFDGPRFDACASFGRVSRLNPSGDNYLSVRAAPRSDAEETDRLGPNTGVSMCQQVGDWIGVVYSPQDVEVPVDCGTTSPIPTRRVYEGPCKSGWVHEDFLKLVAG